VYHVHASSTMVTYSPDRLDLVFRVVMFYHPWGLSHREDQSGPAVPYRTSAVRCGTPRSVHYAAAIRTERVEAVSGLMRHALFQ